MTADERKKIYDTEIMARLFHDYGRVYTREEIDRIVEQSSTHAVIPTYVLTRHPRYEVATGVIVGVYPTSDAADDAATLLSEQTPELDFMINGPYLLAVHLA